MSVFEQAAGEGSDALGLRCLSVSSVIEACHVAAPGPDHFEEHVHPQLQKLIPHDGLAMGFIDGVSLVPTEWGNFSIPRPYTSSYVTADGREVFPVVDAWLNSGRPHLLDDRHLSGPEENAWFQSLQAHGVSNMAVYGVRRADAARGIYIALTGLRQWGAWERFLMQALTPHLQHVTNTQARLASKSGRILTTREQEVLEWVCAGKSNFEIAAILGISVWTVKIHVGKLLSKLNASTRGHAIAKALAGNLVSFRTTTSYKGAPAPMPTY